MNSTPGPRISYGGHNAWRVRVAGKSRTFTFRRYGGEQEALEAAQDWRDEQGATRTYKLSPAERECIRLSKAPRQILAKIFEVSVGYVDQLRRQRP